MSAAPPEPGTREPTWQAQWDRVNRWLHRLRAAQKGELSYIGQPWCDASIGFNLYKDDAYAYFEACYQFKDWLKKDPASADKARDVEEFVSNTDCLRYAADLANRSKHGLADTRPRLDKNAQLRSHRLVVYGADGQFEMAGEEKILVKGDYRDALEVAEECFAAWMAT